MTKTEVGLKTQDTRPKLGELSPFRKQLLVHADSDYVAARVLYYSGSFYLQVLMLCRESLEKYFKLLLLLLKDISDGEADAFLKGYSHRLVKLAKACAAESKGNLRLEICFDPRFIEDIQFIDKQRYETVSRYPRVFAVASNIVQTFDRLEAIPKPVSK